MIPLSLSRSLSFSLSRLLLTYYSAAYREFNGTSCSCPLECGDKVSLELRKKLFDGFWAIVNFHIQNAYLCGLVKVVQPKQRYTTTPGTSRRKYSLMFYLNSKGVSVTECKLLFLRMYAISNGRLDRAPKAQVKERG